MTLGIGYLDTLLRHAKSEALTDHEIDSLCSEVASFFVEYEGVNHQQPGMQQLFGLLRNSGRVGNRRLLASSLIRLLDCRRFAFLFGAEWRRPLLEFVEAELGADIYRDFVSIKSRQAHDKLEVFGRQVGLIEAEFQSALYQLTSLDAADHQQRSLLKVLSKTFGMLVLGPFLPVNIVADLREAYKLVGNYKANNSDPTRVVEVFHGARSALEIMEHALDSFDTEYGHLLAREAIAALRSFVETDLAKKPAVQSSHLRLEFRNKKYQFHAINSLLQVSFSVKNEGPGFAYDIRMQAVSGNGIDIITMPQMTLQRLAPAEVHTFELTVRPLEKRERYEFMLEARWRDFSGEETVVEASEELRSQRDDIDWKTLAYTDPYSLEPVTKEQDLVGRTDVLGRLLGALRSPSVGSAIIRGQKRIGKTSIARVLETTLPESAFLSFYIESGDYKNPSGVETIRLLGDRIVREIRARDPRAAQLPAPVFKGALAPLAEFMDDVLEVIDDRRIVIFIDEFDQLPVELYSRGPLGDSFFLTLRSVTSRPRVGFVLIGGERIAYMLASQGYQVNKWDVIGLDYFSREDHWGDFKELVQRPTHEILEFSEGAFVRLHEATAGNPYFAKLICRNLFRSAVDKRDAHITEIEVETGIEATAREIAENTFAHFWDDGLLVDGEAALHKSIIRRKVLIAVAEARRDNSGTVSMEDINQSRFLAEVVQVEGEVRELVARGILVETSDRRYQFKVDLFGRWLRRRGVKDILLTFGDTSVLLGGKAVERIDAEALWSIVSVWPAFRGRKVRSEDVLQWLSQFGGFREQSAMLPIAQGIRFLTNIEIDEIISAIHVKIVKVLVREENVIRQVARERRKEAEIAVVPISSDACELDFARRYVDRAGIYVKNIVGRAELQKQGLMLNSVKAIVLLKSLVSEHDRSWELLAEVANIVGDIPMFFVALVGVPEGIRRLEESAAAAHMSARIFIGREVPVEEESCFGERSRFYPDAEDRDFARKVFDTFCTLLLDGSPARESPGSYAVTFPFGCPRESLAVLRVSTSQPAWKALFETERCFRMSSIENG